MLGPGGAETKRKACPCLSGGLPGGGGDQPDARLCSEGVRQLQSHHPSSTGKEYRKRIPSEACPEEGGLLELGCQQLAEGEGKHRASAKASGGVGVQAAGSLCLGSGGGRAEWSEAGLGGTMGTRPALPT